LDLAPNISIYRLAAICKTQHLSFLAWTSKPTSSTPQLREEDAIRERWWLREAPTGHRFFDLWMKTPNLAQNPTRGIYVVSM
jgi:hypothetical protein